MTTLHQRHATYRTIERAIHFLRENARRQPPLAEVARHVGLSDTHFQRLFSEWAGISPKRFLQYLTKEHAKKLLKESRDVLDVAYTAGLSGGGRLHDLMVTCEALTPGEIRMGGEGLNIHFGFSPTPLGTMLVAGTTRGICHLHFTGECNEQDSLAQLRRAWPRATWQRDDHHAFALSQRLFAFNHIDKPLHLLLRGTNFQIKVWEALLRVPRGRLISYSGLAARLAMPKAQRAVGSAVAKNDIAFLIPCHRVIRESGELGDYRWGTHRKTALMAWEQQAEGFDD